MKKIVTFTACDSAHNSIILEGKRIGGQTDELAQAIKDIAYLLVPSYTQTEVQFAQKKPADVPTDFMLNSFSPMLEAEIVDWALLEQGVSNHLTKFFAECDWKAGSKAEDIHFLVVAKDRDKNPLGAIQFFFTPEFQAGTVKAALFGVLPSAQNQGIEELLMGSIFTLQPDVKRIFLHTRSTNDNAIDRYKGLGFTEFGGTTKNWTDLEYFADQNYALQSIAAKSISSLCQ